MQSFVFIMSIMGVCNRAANEVKKKALAFASAFFWRLF